MKVDWNTSKLSYGGPILHLELISAELYLYTVNRYNVDMLWHSYRCSLAGGDYLGLFFDETLTSPRLAHDIITLACMRSSILDLFLTVLQIFIPRLFFGERIAYIVYSYVLKLPYMYSRCKCHMFHFQYLPPEISNFILAIFGFVRESLVVVIV